MLPLNTATSFATSKNHIHRKLMVYDKSTIVIFTSLTVSQLQLVNSNNLTLDTGQGGNSPKDNKLKVHH